MVSWQSLGDGRQAELQLLQTSNFAAILADEQCCSNGGRAMLDKMPKQGEEWKPERGESEPGREHNSEQE